MKNRSSEASSRSVGMIRVASERPTRAEWWD
jgi:hypothetical protein